MTDLKLKVFNADGSLKGEFAIHRLEPDPGRLGWYIAYISDGGVSYLSREMLNKWYGNEWWALVQQGSRG